MNPFTFLSNFSKSALKIVLIVTGILIIIPTLFWIGVYIDLGRDSGGFAWAIGLPVGFILLLAYGIYWWKHRSK